MPPVIAIGNYDFRASGTVAKSIEIATAAAAAGLPAELWCIRRQGALLDRVPRQVPVFEIGHGTAIPDRGMDMLRTLFAFALAIRKRKPAIILSGGNHFHIASQTALKFSGRRAVTRFGARASNSTQRSGRPIEDVHHRIRRKFGAADFIPAVSTELADELRDAGLAAAISVIPNGVDIDRVHALAAQPCDHPWLRARNGPVIVTMGRIERQKGFDIVIRALARLRPALLPVPRLIIIGDGKTQAFARLTAIAQAEGVADLIDFVGFQANPFAFLARADLFVSGSRWEGASNTLIEALACGLPIAATACPTGNREVIERGPFGSLCAVGDFAGLADAMATELAIGRDRNSQVAGAQNWAIGHCMDQWAWLLGQEYAAATGAAQARLALRR